MDESLISIAVQGIKELLSKNGYDWSMNYPNKIERVAMRMKFFNPHGIAVGDLATYDFIFVFQNPIPQRLISFKLIASIWPVSLHSMNAKDFFPEDFEKDPKKIEELIAQVKVAVKRFVAE